MTNEIKKIKIFETTLIYIFLSSLISGFLLIGKCLDIYFKFSKVYNQTFKFSDILLEFNKYISDFKSLEVLLLIYRIVILASCITLILFIIYRIATKEISKLKQFSTILSFITTIYSCYLIYLTSGVYNALKLLNSDAVNSIYLAYKIQKIKNIRYIIIGIFLFVMLLTFISLFVSIYEATRKNDIVLTPTINSVILSISMIMFFVLGFVTYRVQTNSSFVKPFDYLMIKYNVDDDNKIKVYTDIDIKKLENKHINPKIRQFLENELVYNIKSMNKI